MCEWKSARSRPLVRANAPRAVTAATRTAFGARGEDERLAALLALRGVGVPIASALLHFAMPGRYPILDVRALESLGHTGTASYTVRFWVAYVEACRALATRHAISLRELDKALWQHSRGAAGS